MRLILLALCLIGIYGILLIGKADCQVPKTMAQYKIECPDLKQNLKDAASEVTAIDKAQGTTAAQKKAGANLVAALKKAEVAVNKCDPNCSCKGKTLAACNACINNALKAANKDTVAFDNAMNG